MIKRRRMRFVPHRILPGWIPACTGMTGLKYYPGSTPARDENAFQMVLMVILKPVVSGGFSGICDFYNSGFIIVCIVLQGCDMFLGWHATRRLGASLSS